MEMMLVSHAKLLFLCGISITDNLGLPDPNGLGRPGCDIQNPIIPLSPHLRVGGPRALTLPEMALPTISHCPLPI